MRNTIPVGSRGINRKFEEDLQAFITLAMQLSANMTWKELVQASNLSFGCIHNLCTGKTRSPHLRTIYKLAHAVGLAVSIGDNKSIKLRVA